MTMIMRNLICPVSTSPLPPVWYWYDIDIIPTSSSINFLVGASYIHAYDIIPLSITVQARRSHEAGYGPDSQTHRLTDSQYITTSPIIAFTALSQLVALEFTDSYLLNNSNSNDFLCRHLHVIHVTIVSPTPPTLLVHIHTPPPCSALINTHQKKKILWIRYRVQPTAQEPNTQFCNYSLVGLSLRTEPNLTCDRYPTHDPWLQCVVTAVPVLGG